MTTGRVLHTGQAIVDVVLEIDALPEPGGDTYAHHNQITAGGGTNVMTAAARDGAEVVYLGARGDGPFGDLVTKALVADHISLPNPPVTGVDTGYCVALVDSSSERTFISTLGAEGRSDLANLQAVEATADDVVYVTGYSFLHPTNREALLTWLPALPSGTRVVADPSPLVAEVPDEALAVLRQVTWLWTLNAREGRLMANRLGLDGDGAQPDAVTLASLLARALDARIVLRCGSDGCVQAVPGEAPIRRPAVKVDAVDTNGAGDSHAGVMMAVLARGGSLDEALTRATVASAMTVTRRGPATSPTADEIDDALGR